MFTDAPDMKRSRFDSTWIWVPLVLGLFVMVSGVTHVEKPREPLRNNESLMQLRDFLSRQLPQLSIFSDLKFRSSSSDFEISFQSDSIFVESSSSIRDEALPELDVLASVVKIAGSDFQIIVEAHVDPVTASRRKKRYASDWDLTGARAFRIVRIFEQNGFPSARLRGAGYGASRSKPDRAVAQTTDPSPAGATVGADERRLVIRFAPLSSH